MTWKGCPSLALAAQHHTRTATAPSGTGWITIVLCLFLAVTAPALHAANNTSQKDAAKTARKPHPAMIEPLAAHSLLLDVTNTGRRMVTVGARGHILISRNGNHWTQVPNPSRATLTAVDFADPDHGWAVGWDAVILHTADGGQSWQLQYFRPSLERPLLDVLALSSEHAVAVGARGLLLVTRNGGRHWTRVKPKFDPQAKWHLSAITQLQDGTLFIAGEKGTLGYSSDAGKTWKALASPYPGPLFDAAPIGAHGVLIAGLQGNVYCTPAPGKPWHEIDIGTGATIMGATQVSGNRIVLAGQNGIIRSLTGDDCSAKIRVATPANTAFSDLTGGTLSPDGALIMIGKAGIRRLGVTGHDSKH